MFFGLSPEALRESVLRLAKATGWALAEIGALHLRELLAWVEAIPAQAPIPVYLVEFKHR